LLFRLLAGVVVVVAVVFAKNDDDGVDGTKPSTCDDDSISSKKPLPPTAIRQNDVGTHFMVVQ